MAARERNSLLDVLWSRLRKTPKPAPPPIGPTRRFQAISIYRGTTACPTAKRFSEHRFLAKDAPQLPLVGCTMASTCQCRYLKHKDRRSDRRRLLDFSASSRNFLGQDRRQRIGRRSSD
jgi:hypothetical protein